MATPNYNGIIPTIKIYDYEKKELNVKRLVMYYLNRLQSMFEWNGLPKSIPKRDLELFLMTNGNVCFTKANDGELDAFTGGYGGVPNAYYRPTQYIIANPYLNFNKVCKIDEDCVVMANDSLWQGMLPLLTRYCTLMVENDLTMRLRSITSRSEFIALAEDSKGKLSLDAFFQNLEDGKLKSILNRPTLFDGIKTQPYANASGNGTTQLIELQQYLKASLFNEIGLNANYNMKRESINSGEATLNDDALLPLIDDMLEQRKLACEKINEMFGTNISVDYSSVWKQNQEEIDIALERQEKEVETPTTPQEDTPQKEGEEDGTKETD